MPFSIRTGLCHFNPMHGAIHIHLKKGERNSAVVQRSAVSAPRRPSIQARIQSAKLNGAASSLELGRTPALSVLRPLAQMPV